jgi:hypothetical protein
VLLPEARISRLLISEMSMAKNIFPGIIVPIGDKNNG